METEQLQIYKDTFLIAKDLLMRQRHVSRLIKYGEYANAVSLTLEAMDYAYTASVSAAERQWALTRYLICIGGVRSRIRLFGETKFITPDAQTHLMRMIDNVKRQAIGWRKTSQRQSREVNDDAGVLS